VKTKNVPVFTSIKYCVKKKGRITRPAVRT